jgi:hemerythrin
MPFQWSEELATGVSWIDAQHQCLFDMLNDLEEQLERDEPAEQMTKIIDGLAEYAREHFGLEEGCMLLCECPAAAQNKAAHLAFIRMLGAKMEELRSGPPSRELFVSLRQEIEKWLTLHICKIDKTLAKNLGKS